MVRGRVFGQEGQQSILGAFYDTAFIRPHTELDSTIPYFSCLTHYSFHSFHHPTSPV